EAKLLHQYDHRWATYDGAETRDLSATEKADPRCTVMPRYWVPAVEVEARLAGRWERGWLPAFRDIARNTDERTAIFSLLPRVGVGLHCAGNAAVRARLGLRWTTVRLERGAARSATGRAARLLCPPLRPHPQAAPLHPRSPRPDRSRVGGHPRPRRGPVGCAT